jgi:putative ABC transport system permease protein
MSSRNVINALKGKFSDIQANTIVKRTLIGFQFTIAIIVLVAAIIVSQQIDKFFGDNLGYNKEFIVSSQVPRDWTPEGTRKMLRVRSEFAKLPQVESVTLSFEIPNGMNGFDPMIYSTSTDSTQAKSMQQLVTDAFYFDTYKIAMKAGANFSEIEADSSKAIINETAVKALGWSSNQEAIGQQLKVVGNPFVFTVKGVVSDFHFNSLQQETRGMLFLQSTLVNNYRYLSFKLKPGNIAESIKAIETKWASLLPGSSFEYSFMDQTLERMYGSELQLKKAAMLSTAIAFFLVLMGVLGMVSFSIQKRMKEVGVRKVLGAPVFSILYLFLKEFLGLILLAGVIASPLAYLLMDKWLNNYVYRISITPIPFLASIALVVLVTILLIVARTRKAVAANPVNSLRAE